MTIPLLILFWRCSNSSGDHGVSVDVLLKVFSRCTRIEGTHRLVPGSAQLMARLLAGGGSSLLPSTSPVDACEAIVSAFTKHFNYLAGENACRELYFVLDVYTLSVKHEPAFLSVLRRSIPFWRNMLALLRRSVRSEMLSTDEGRKCGPTIVTTTILHINMIMHTSILNTPDEKDAAVKTLVQADLFGTLDDLMPQLLPLREPGRGGIASACDSFTLFSLKKGR